MLSSLFVQMPIKYLKSNFSRQVTNNTQFNNLMALVTNLAQTTQANTKSFQHLIASQALNGNGKEGGGQFILQKFIKNGAKYYKGAIDPVKTEKSIKNMYKNFSAMEVPTQHKVWLVVCMLEEDVAFWWEFAMRTNFVGRGQDTITSEEFVEVFILKYYPDYICECKAREFMNLM